MRYPHWMRHDKEDIPLQTFILVYGMIGHSTEGVTKFVTQDWNAITPRNMITQRWPHYKMPLPFSFLYARHNSSWIVIILIDVKFIIDNKLSKTYS